MAASATSTALTRPKAANPTVHTGPGLEDFLHHDHDGMASVTAIRTRFGLLRSRRRPTCLAKRCRPSHLWTSWPSTVPMLMWTLTQDLTTSSSASGRSLALLPVDQLTALVAVVGLSGA